MCGGSEKSKISIHTDGDNEGEIMFRSKIFKAGLILLIVGVSPLLLYVLYEFVTGATGGNPIGLGLLFFVTFWPAVIMMVIGVISALIAKKNANSGK